MWWVNESHACQVWPPAQPDATVEDYLNALQKQLHFRCQVWSSLNAA